MYIYITLNSVHVAHSSTGAPTLYLGRNHRVSISDISSTKFFRLKARYPKAYDLMAMCQNLTTGIRTSNLPNHRHMAGHCS